MNEVPRLQPSATRVLAVVILIVLAGACAGTSQTHDLPGDTPEDALATYRGLLDDRTLSNRSQVLTPASRDLLSRSPSGAQQAAEAAALARVWDGRVTAISGQRAVVRFESPEVSPYFLQEGTDGWQVDLAAMAQYIGFDGSNHWSLRSTSHPYMFAFR